MKIVIFDWGQVLTDIARLTCDTNNDFWKCVIRRMGYSTDESVDTRLDTFRPYHHKCEKNDSDINTLNFIIALLDVFGIYGTEENIRKFKECYIEEALTWETNSELVKYAHSLRKREVQIGLFSNLLSLDKYRQDLDVNRAMFDFVWLSCDLGARKPEIAIYKRVMEDLSSDYDIMFIDNNEDNIMVAKEFGWNTYLYKGDNTECIKCIELFIGSE